MVDEEVVETYESCGNILYGVLSLLDHVGGLQGVLGVVGAMWEL